MGELFSGFFNRTVLIAFGLGLVFSLILGPIIIPMLHKLKFGQNIRKDGPQSHMKKAGTPTIGGLIFLISITLVMIVMRYKFTSEGMIVLYGTLAFGLIGFLDDILKIIHKDNEGLKSGQKFILQIVFSIALAYYGYKFVGTSISIPFADFAIDLKWIYIPFVIFYYAAITNAVNLTDGLDGLATSVSALVFTFFSILAFNMGHYSVAVFAIALVGALIGFLKFNAYKASVFMGDTGSLALGGALATIMMVLKTPLVVLIVGGIYVAETLSVVIQVTSFKLTGKRVFKMAPLHHHFEQCGWSEVKIVTVFSIITLILCIIGFVSL
ncbi:MAG: phospho-N-acetylmuramoyl-pentapeptide-transferase [Clostridium sp.]|uniref:Phospho-N-acetylmuramoyl-pentapeptide-transferase n=1 Tax=Clostridium paraputrificum TaxID=29363 RepID=A0A6N3DEZ6_9CLOT|nr:phospho-N-acetylmuramoyl-pentapeptide-transferase [Clostridium sp.]MBS5926496.1 phospho-N-acetylmuramoyl-pentapeptide-transferase [Clostridium sp.]MBS5985049.1 phospho-N-acetylmuramoyl-pentapeptide-transferase [Clostridium sp.]